MPGAGSSGCSTCATTSCLLAEEFDTDAGRQVGNTPQAFSHVELVTSAQQLAAVTPDPDALPP